MWTYMGCVYLWWDTSICCSSCQSTPPLHVDCTMITSLSESGLGQLPTADLLPTRILNCTYLKHTLNDCIVLLRVSESPQRPLYSSPLVLLNRSPTPIKTFMTDRATFYMLCCLNEYKRHCANQTLPPLLLLTLVILLMNSWRQQLPYAPSWGCYWWWQNPQRR